MSGDELVEAPRREYRKRVLPRVEHALNVLVTGERRTITAAAETAGLTRRALTMALAKPHVKERMAELIRGSLRVSALKATATIDNLLTAENSMTALKAAEYCLGAGMGIAAPARPSSVVNIGISTEKAGIVIDLSEVEPNADKRVVRWPGSRAPTSQGAPLIEGHVERPADADDAA